MKNLSRKIDINFELYINTVINFSVFYAKFFMLTARNHSRLILGVGFETGSDVL